ncbi:MAG: Type II secretion system protein G precursor [Pelotomaculum sp. PtaB.Bin013]|nr:MAG: Type II secretion system protein G precursor [Pelotomaculum sp. PtaB.Bin013]
MVVIVIIGVLASIAVPTMSKQVDKAKVKRAMVEMKTMKTAIDVYKAEKGSYPATAQINDVLKDYGINFGATSCKDPWEKPYVYSTDVNTAPSAYKIVSYGPDGGFTTENDNIMATGSTNPAESTSNADAALFSYRINSDGSTPAP